MSNTKKIIHALTIIDKSTSMERFRSRTVEGVNSNISALKNEVDADTDILNTQLQFSSASSYWRVKNGESPVPSPTDFRFIRVGENVMNLVDMTLEDYVTAGGTPLLDAIGYGIERVKEFHGDKLGDDNLKIIVTIFTDGEENSSSKWSKSDIKKMIEHFQSDGKWTFTFVGCGSFENVTSTSSGLGVAAANTVAYDYSDAGNTEAYAKIATSYTNFARSAKLGVVDKELFVAKELPKQ